MIDIASFLINWLIYFAIYAVLAVTLNLEAGLTGIVNFGKVAFFGLGAYIGTIINTYLLLVISGINIAVAAPYTAEGVAVLSKIATSNPALVIGTFILSITISFIVAGVFGYLLTYPVIRVGAGFVGFTLLCVGEVLRAVYINTEFVGGTYGILGIPQPFAWVGNPFTSNIYYLLLVLTVLFSTYMVAHRIIESPLGRTLRAIRDDDIASLCLGKDVPKVKSKIFFLTSALSGVAGTLYACYISSVSPQMFVMLVTFNLWAMIIIGGLGNPLGAVTGALILTLIERVLLFITPLYGYLPFTPDYLRPIITGLIMTTTLIKYPRGLFPEKPPKFVKKIVEEFKR
ncbi:MAG: branched-chain amino acid ABC transporter permease [Desulfurococcaceae archaeon]